MNDIFGILTIVKKQNNKKVNTASRLVFMQALLAGMFIGIGGTAAIKVSNKFLPTDGMGSIVSAFVFTIGFVLIISLGVQLFTSSNLLTLNVLDKEVSLKKVLINWMIVWIGNLLGAFFMGLLLYLANGYTLVEQHYIEHIIEHKVSLDFMSAILLGIGCNIIITLTVLLAAATNDYLSKVVVSIFGVMIFLLCGFEHVVANMYYFSIGGLYGMASMSSIMYNLLFVTIGNLLGGALLIPLLFHFTFKSK